MRTIGHTDSLPIMVHRTHLGYLRPRRLATSCFEAWEDGAVMERFETESLALIPGQRVRAKVLEHQPWGVIAQIVGYERVGASVDIIAQFWDKATSPEQLLAMYPPVDTMIDAVVYQVGRWNPPAWVRLSIRPEDLASFRQPCDFCGQPTTLSAGGDGLVLDVRSNDGPGSHTVTSHRTCLVDRITPEDNDVRWRARNVGHSTD